VFAAVMAAKQTATSQQMDPR